MMKWEYIDPSTVDSKFFGFKPSVVKVCQWNDDKDVRTFGLMGWDTFSIILDFHPVTRKKLNSPEWFMFAAK